jgi:hypothetical protein
MARPSAAGREATMIEAEREQALVGQRTPVRVRKLGHLVLAVCRAPTTASRRADHPGARAGCLGPER